MIKVPVNHPQKPHIKQRLGAKWGLRKGLIILLTTVILSGCGGGSYTTDQGPNAGRYSQKHDSGPTRNINVDDIPNAVPRYEKKSRGGNPKSYKVFGKRYYVMDSAKGYVQEGTCSWYGNKFHGHDTSNGEKYDMYAMTAAHKTLPLPSFLKVTNLNNGRWVIVRVNDRGPFHGNRICDLSYTAAKKLGITAKGTGRVELRAITPGPYDNQRIAQKSAAPQSTAPKYKPIPKGIYLQLGAFIGRSNAETLVQKLAQANFNDAKIFTNAGPNGPIHRVRIGPFSNASPAEDIALQIKTLGIGNPKVLTQK